MLEEGEEEEASELIKGSKKSRVTVQFAMRTHFTSFARPHVTGVPKFMGYPHCASSEFSSPSLLEGGQCL